MARKLTEAQRRALRLIKYGDYHYHRNSGSLRHIHHRPGRTPVIYRQTAYALKEAGLFRYDPFWWGRAELTEAGWKALEG